MQCLNLSNDYSKDEIGNTVNVDKIYEHKSDHDEFNVLFNFREWQASNPDNFKVTKPTYL